MILYTCSNGLKDQWSRFLHFFCLGCGNEYGDVSLTCGKCESCSEPLFISTETALIQAFEDAPGRVKRKILETIEHRFWRLQARIFFTITPRIMRLDDEKHIGSFCVGCGELLWGASFDRGACACCGAAVTRATEEQLQADFLGAPETVKTKIIQGIMYHRTLLMFFRGRTRTTFWNTGRSLECDAESAERKAYDILHMFEWHGREQKPASPLPLPGLRL